MDAKRNPKEWQEMILVATSGVSAMYYHFYFYILC